MSSPTLFTAVEQGNLQAVNALLQAGADSNTRNAEEMTPLMVEMLIVIGALVYVESGLLKWWH